jgi:hypothetical protein
MLDFKLLFIAWMAEPLLLTPHERWVQNGEVEGFLNLMALPLLFGIAWT